MWPPEDDVQPMRSWDDLVAGSRRRGTRLRRRRRVALAAPVLALASVLAVPYALTVTGTDADALVTDTATRPDVVPAPEDADREIPTPAAVAEAPVVPRQAPVAPPAEPRARQEQRVVTAGPAAVAAPRGAAEPAPEPGRTAAPAEGDRIVSFSDQAGDGYTHLDPDGQVRADSESVPARDILAMRFVAEPEGVRVTMDLAGERDADDDHWAFVTDARSGCQMDIAFGSRGIEGYYAQCPDGFTSPFVEVPHLEDPSPQRLVVFVPYQLFPRQMDPARPLSGLSGQTRRRHGLQGQFRADTASTSQVLAGRSA